MSGLALLGGNPVVDTPLPPRVSMQSQEKEAALRVMDSDVLSGFVGASGKFFNGGSEVQRFEALWTRLYGYPHVITTNSWTTGLQAAVGAIGIEPGDEIICPPYTMSATATCVLFYGGVPIFADIDPNNLCLDPASIESKISPRTKAIIVVHLFGCPADMQPILAIAAKHNLRVIEDAAQAPGVLYKGVPVGTIGDIGGFSLNYHKHIQAGEGGVLVTKNDKLADICRLIRNHGENTYFEEDEPPVNFIGSNYRLTELQAAIGYEQLLKLESKLQHRAMLASYLTSRLSSVPGLTTQLIDDGSTHSFYMYPIFFNAKVLGVSRNTFLRAVLAEFPKPISWDTTPISEGYVKPLYLNPIYQRQIAIGSKNFPFTLNNYPVDFYSKGLCPVSEQMYEQSLLLTPLIREGLSLTHITLFADAIEKVITHIDDLRSFDKDTALQSPTVYDAIKAIDDAA